MKFNVFVKTKQPRIRIKEFILKSMVPCRVSFCSMTLDSRVHDGGWGLGQNLVVVVVVV